MTARPCPLDGAALASGQVLCGACTTRWRLDLGEVPALLRELDVAITRQTSMPPTSGTVRCGRDGCTHGPDEAGCVQGVRLDLDVRASEASLALRLCLHGWARVWDEETPVPDVPHGPTCTPWTWARPSSCRHMSCAQISRRAAWMGNRAHLLSTPQGQAAMLRYATRISAAAWLPDAAAEIRDAVREGWAACDRPPDTTVVGRCPECGRALYGPEGATLVRCGNCGTRCNRADVRADSLAESRTLVTAVQLATALGAPIGTIRSWVSRRQLTAVRCDMDGRPLYRVADGQALHAQGEDREEVAAGG